ncbi:MAG: HD domain-containing protein [Desulfuromonadaceae bacterium]|nr:HD domain-containing protein [Desulfuromonadaceae bacterium]
MLFPNRHADLLKQIFPLPCHDRIFMVGGIVRDILLGQEGQDIDLAAALTADELSSSGFRLVSGKSTAPIWLLHDPAFGKIELTAIPDSAALTYDLARRDFTINAIAMNLAGEIIDPMSGKRDLELHLLRLCTPESFQDDPLRIFRALRFEACGWGMTAETEALIRTAEWNVPLLMIPVERFSREMLKAMESPEPERYFQRMLELNVGETFLPELFRFPAIPAGPPIHHPEGDLFTHSCQVLQRVSLSTDNPLTRFCAFFHDIGKLATDPADYPKHHGHDRAGFQLAIDFCDRLRLPANYRIALAWISRLHGKLNIWDEQRDATKIRMAGRAVKAGIEEILPLVSEGDKPGGQAYNGWWEAVRISGLTTSQLRIDRVRLEEMKGEKRGDYILQKRVELFRGSSATPPASPL